MPLDATAPAGPPDRWTWWSQQAGQAGRMRLASGAGAGSGGYGRGQPDVGPGGQPELLRSVAAVHGE
jgi:hypothetical protein